MFGISHNSVVYLLEQLFGANNCRNYNFRYHRYDQSEIEEVSERWTCILIENCLKNIDPSFYFLFDIKLTVLLSQFGLLLWT